MKSILACILAGSLTLGASAQSFNIDFGDNRTAPGAGYPAAGLPGAWNALGVPTPGIYYPMVNLQGQATIVQLNNLGGTQLLSADNPATVGDDQALMDDMLIGFNNPVDVCIWVRNLNPGPYEVLIYAMTPDDSNHLNRTRVDFANQGPIWIGGAWPGAHQLNLTYSRHTVTVTDGVIGLHSGVFGGNIQSGINGIQIRPLVPGDTNGNTQVNIDDLLNVIISWGACPADPPLCPADVNGSGSVNIDDLLMVINNWG